MERLRPDDHFMILAETDANPMHIGALLCFDVSDEERGDFAARMIQHVKGRLPLTPLIRTLRRSPLGYDSDAWVETTSVDWSKHIFLPRLAHVLDDEALHRFVAEWSVERLDLGRPPFTIHLLDRLANGRCAMLIKVHHAVTDGIGFQSILELLADGGEPSPQPAKRNRRPVPLLAIAQSWLRFQRLKKTIGQSKEQRRAALRAIAEIEAGPHPRTATTKLPARADPTIRRAYATLSLPLAVVRSTGKQLGATINDMLLAITASALRKTLTSLDELPTAPLVASAARSYRQPEHGRFGNRIVALNPSLATNIDNPLERLHAIQQSMANELRRTHLDQALLDQPDIPFGARDRRAKFAGLTRGNAPMLPGNVTVSNVPGPAEPPTIAGFRQVGNYPTPLLAAGRFLNVTSRRNGDHLDVGFMADARYIPDLSDFVRSFVAALDEYTVLARHTTNAS